MQHFLHSRVRIESKSRGRSVRGLARRSSKRRQIFGNIPDPLTTGPPRHKTAPLCKSIPPAPFVNLTSRRICFNKVSADTIVLWWHTHTCLFCRVGLESVWKPQLMWSVLGFVYLRSVSLSGTRSSTISLRAWVGVLFPSVWETNVWKKSLKGANLGRGREGYLFY